MMNALRFTYAVLLLFYGLNTKAQDFNKYEKEIFIKGRDSIQYRILYPENFSEKEKYPVLFVLHGSGERGEDNHSQLIHGAALFLKETVRRQFPAIVVFPQCPSDSYWANVRFTTEDGKRTFNFQTKGEPTKSMRGLLGMLNNFLQKPFVDQKKVYVGGLSMGAMGTYELLRRKPKTFAAAFAICGGDHVANVQKYKHVPLWIFHGEKDAVVPVAFATTIANQLVVLGKPAKLSLYPEADHNSWDSAFAEPELLPWLFSNHK